MNNSTADERLAQSGYVLPPAPKPVGVYKPALIDGKYLYVSGHGPFREDGTLIIGRVGVDLALNTKGVISVARGRSGPMPSSFPPSSSSGLSNAVAYIPRHQKNVGVV